MQKYFGQNFLLSQNAHKKIIETAKITNKDHIVEIGPGLGVLTQELAKKTKKVTTIELDKTLLPILEETLKQYTNIKIINQDALRFTPPTTPYKVVANIPYNITSPLINHFLQAENKPATLTLLVQKEVAEKICTLKHKTSILSLQIALFGQAKLIKTIKKTAFYPSPKVDSAILYIQLYKKSHPNYIPTKEALQILKLAKQAFTQRRKKLRNTLHQHKEALKKLGLEDQRPETLSIKDWQTLKNTL